jgi:8-oxo-dGTP pyrophosphatase MutT (NUDIX family)
MIVKSSLVLVRGEYPGSALLMVREQENSYWLFPGGKQEAGESIEDALTREIREELSADVKNVTNLGTVEGSTPDGVPLRMHLFQGETEDELVASSEIESLRWITRTEVPSIMNELTPITCDKVFPFLAENEIW